jgi:hypothetical protein
MHHVPKVKNFITLDSGYRTFIVNRHCGLQAEALVKTGRLHIQAKLDNILEVMQLLPENCVVVDAAANIGLRGIPVTQAIAAKGGTVHAFEPQRLLNYALCGAAAPNDIENLMCIDAAWQNPREWRTFRRWTTHRKAILVLCNGNLEAELKVMQSRLSHWMTWAWDGWIFSSSLLRAWKSMP